MLAVMIDRILENKVSGKLNQGKAIIILGASQVGKTTLLEKTFLQHEDVLWLAGDSPDTKALFESSSAERLRLFFGNKSTVIINEAQLIPEIGQRLKLITDQIKEVQLIATGSSSFDLSGRLKEPLTDRKWEYRLFPLSFGEMVTHHGLLAEKRSLMHRLVYGYYPDVINHPGEEQRMLKRLAEHYTYKNILMLEHVRKPDRIIKLMQVLACKVGNQVSFQELGQLCGLDNKTVEKYITLLEQVFIIFRLWSFSNNLGNELKFSRKFYFMDNGIRNALISDFKLAENRTDIGALWENFLVSERLKKNTYEESWVNCWFWRTAAHQEIDYIEESPGRLNAYRFQWDPARPVKISKSFTRAYPRATIKIIHPENFEEFLLKED